MESEEHEREIPVKFAWGVGLPELIILSILLYCAVENIRGVA